MKKNRLQYSLLNSSISTIIYVFRLILQFVVRTYFIKFLGAEYLGLNGLFTNILSILSLAELGIGTSIVYSMYKPLADENRQKIRSLMQLYKKAYNYIGLLVGLIGICIIPFLKYMIKSDLSINEIYIIYILFLLNSVVSYFFTYKRSLIIADQRSYIVSLNDFIFLLITNIIQIAVLYLYPNFIVYLSIQIFFTFLTNLNISRKTDKDYPYLKEDIHEKLEPETISEIKKNVIGNVSSKIGGVVVMGTDNILISTFVSLTAVGIYSNYLLLVNSVQNLCKQVTNSITASIGNFAATTSKDKGFELFKRHLFVNHTLIFFSSVVLLNVLNPFIKLWLGPDFLLSDLNSTLIVFNFIIQVYRNTGFVFIESYGLYWHQRKKPIIEAIMNLVISLVFLSVFKLGIAGVLLGTIISSLGYVIWYEAYIVFKHAFDKSFFEFIKIMLNYFLQIVLSWGGASYFSRIALRDDGSVVDVIVSVIVSLITGIIVYLSLNFKRKEFRFVVSIVGQILNKIKGKL
ncbi:MULTISPECIES: lipopolysaccharide biosynthesis protein [unclassified Enterococcus]